MRTSLHIGAGLAALALSQVAHAQSSEIDDWDDTFDHMEVITLEDLTGREQEDAEFGFSLAAGERSLLIGAPGLLVGGERGGGIFQLRGSGTSLNTSGNVSPRTQSSRGASGTPENSDRFGHAIAAARPYGNTRTCNDAISANRDTDTYCWEYLIGAPGEAIGSTANAGMVNVLAIHNDAPNRTLRQIHQGVSGIAGSVEAGDWVGGALAVGDFNGDGADDVAVGAPGENHTSIRDTGAVNVVFADELGLLDRTRNGLTALDDHLLIDPSTILSSGDERADYDMFGYALAAGDFNGDGVDDLAVGEPNGALGGPGNIVRSGHVHLFHGTDGNWADGFDNRSQTLVSQSTVGFARPEAGDVFGTALAAGDFNGDGVSDLAVGIPGEGIGDIDNAGMVQVFYGRSRDNIDDLALLPYVGNYIGPATEYLSNAINGLVTAFGVAQGLHQGTPGVPGGNETGDMFGASLAGGDINGDGFDDLVIAIPGEDLRFGDNDYADAGRVVIVFGSMRGLETVDEAGNSAVANIDERTIPGVMQARAAARFGFSLAIGKFNDGPQIDLAIGNNSRLSPIFPSPLDPLLTRFDQTVTSNGRVSVFYND